MDMKSIAFLLPIRASECKFQMYRKPAPALFMSPVFVIFGRH